MKQGRKGKGEKEGEEGRSLFCSSSRWRLDAFDIDEDGGVGWVTQYKSASVFFFFFFSINLEGMKSSLEFHPAHNDKMKNSRTFLFFSFSFSLVSNFSEKIFFHLHLQKRLMFFFFFFFRGLRVRKRIISSS